MDTITTLKTAQQGHFLGVCIISRKRNHQKRMLDTLIFSVQIASIFAE
jgi:hypothetical protein